MKSPRPTGFTLVEMVVVLTILVLLAGLAVSSLDNVVDQTRFDSSRAGLREIEEAVLGEAGLRNPDGTVLNVGFVADVGRLPLYSGDAAKPLSQLWLASGLPAFAVQTPVGDPEVRLAAGWRGPYVRLPMGAVSLENPWGNVDVVLKADGSPATGVTDPVGIVRSLGSNNASGGTAYDADVDAVLDAATGAPWKGSLSVSLTWPGAGMPGNHLVVRVYGPADGLVVTLRQIVFDHVWTVVASTLPTDSGGVGIAVFNDLPIGTRVVRAYQTAAVPAPADPLVAPAPRSPATTVVLVKGGVAQNLVVP